MKAILGLAILALVATGIWGWVLNIIGLVHLAHEASPNLVLAGLRIVGIFVAPLGAVLGLLA